MAKVDRYAGEGAECSCESEEQHAVLVARTDTSFVEDIQRRKNAPTSETMRNKVLAHTATTNGHSSIKI